MNINLCAISYAAVLGMLLGCNTVPTPQQDVKNINENKVLRIATFNVSMEATNYQSSEQSATKSTLNAHALTQALASGDVQQINNIAEIIQRTRPDIILLNEFDYIAKREKGIDLFKTAYLEVSQNGLAPITYPYVYLAPVNTGVKTGLKGEAVKLTHFGFGRYVGQYGMVLLSKYPIVSKQVRTFQHFLWQDMPNNLMPVNPNGSQWYSSDERAIMRLSSKSHWDVPVTVCDNTIHVLASHPTPPVFDGEEDRNGKRNHDEIRFWRDYISPSSNHYIYDDNGRHGGVSPQSFVILGDLNASAVDGDAHPNAINQLLSHPDVNHYGAPQSEGGLQNKPENKHAATHTAGWGMRADYVLPSANLKVLNSAVFWPAKGKQGAHLVADRSASSDHRLVWVDIALANACEQ
ncbi:endonuclease/exonuclease/phosphatase family protein [Pseudoalteromonas spongiae]|uniref:endonuclease/exonuclease/phosphatase family protein n=1 Tax=Pseudoalteromonas spongiae TaxID=298657 RepID=UPI0037358DB0